MSVHPHSVSVIDPISSALSRVKTILFSPFDIRKWFVIGFCAFLSSCGETGGSGSGGNYGNRSGDSISRGDIRQGMEHAWQYVLDNLGWILPLVILGVLVIVGLWLLVLWLNSRGKFMLLHCVALNRAEIQVPWETYAAHAHSLFLFRIVMGLLAFLILFPLVAGSIAMILFALMNEGPLAGPITLAVVGFLCAVCVGLTFAAVKKLLEDFVVPIMFLRTQSVREAWREFLPLMSANLWRFIGYLLFSVLLGMIMGTAILLLVLLTCCTALCLMMIPYIGTVLLLPIFVFKRAYSLYYYEQYGPDYTLIPREEMPPNATPGGLQPV